MKIREKIDKFNDVLIICNNKTKRKLIEFFSNQGKLRKIIYKTPSQVVDDILGSYLNKARIELAKEENISPELAGIKLENSLLVPIGLNEKLKKLKKLNSLTFVRAKYAKYLEIKPLIYNLYKNRQIIVFNNPKLSDNFMRAIGVVEEINPKIIYLDSFINNLEEVEVFQFETSQAEIRNLLNEIACLLEKGVDPSKIKVQMPNEYYSSALELFSLANIDLNIEVNHSLSEYEISKKILRSLQGLLKYSHRAAFNLVLEEYQPKNNIILTEIIKVFNSYLSEDYLLSEIYGDLVQTFNTTKIKNKYIGGINVCNVLEEVINEDDYLFVVGLNQDVFPKAYSDNEYLLDYEREELGLLTSSEKNQNLTLYLLKVFKNMKNLYLSYPLESFGGALPVSSFVGKLGKECHVLIKKKRNPVLVSYSEDIDRLTLGKHLDLYYKFNLESEDLYTFYNAYPDLDYRSYNNQFTCCSKEFLGQYLKKGLTLSYTAIDKYYKCGFLFYLENVLKIRRASNEESLLIGNIVHEVLYQVLNEKKHSNSREFIEEVVHNYLKREEVELTKRDEFFIDLYLDIVQKFIGFMEQQAEESNFEIFGLEKEFSLDLDGDIKIKLVGKIDKILTLDYANKKYAIVIDYKTGSTEFDLNRIIHGINMQIMFYFFFLNYSSETGGLKNQYQFAGGYLQGVLPNNVFAFDKNKTFAEQLENHFKLVGYSIDDLLVLGQMEENIVPESKFIASFKFTKDNSFYAYTKRKVLNQELFWELLKVIELKIKEAIQGIKKGEFFVNPKKIGNKFDSCTYCQYQDLCFKDNSNYQNLREFKNFEFVEGLDDSN